MRNIILTLTILFTISLGADTRSNNKTSVEEMSQQLLTNIKNGKSTESIELQLKNMSMKDIREELTTDDQKIAFWVNIYNAYIQIKLNANPSLYDNRGNFFGLKQVAIGGELLSFEKIEHGFLRRSQKPAGLGYVKKIFPGRLERKMRVDNVDYRIHFALNCGAKSCPPVGIYSSAKLDAELEYMTSEYLKNNTTYDAEKNTVYTTTLFSWFRGDFGGRDGAKEILIGRKLMKDMDVKLEFNKYDWTLLTNQFVDIKI